METIKTSENNKTDEAITVSQDETAMGKEKLSENDLEQIVRLLADKPDLLLRVLKLNTDAK